MKLMEPDYSNSIWNVSHTILAHYGHHTDVPLIPELKEELDNNYKHVCLFLLDGMGTNIIKKHLRHKDFLKKHVIKKITSVYPPTTVAATNTVLTCKTPYESGYLGWTQYFTDDDVYAIVFRNEDYYDADKALKLNYRDTYLKHDLIFDYIKRADASVQTYKLFPNFEPGGFETFNEQLEEVKKITKQDSKTFSYIYWTNPDDMEHRFGPKSKEVKEELRSLSAQLDRFSKQLNPDTLVIVIADHGQIEVKPVEFTEQTYLYDMLSKKPSLEPRTPAFFVKDDKHLEFRMMFSKMFETRYKLYASHDFIESGLIGYGSKHPMLDQFVGDFVAVAISDSYLKFKKTALYKGHHAGLTKDEMEVPLIIYSNKK